MSDKKEKKDDFFEQVDYGIRLGAIDALKEHKRLGLPIHIMKDGKVVEVPANDIVIPKEPKPI